MIDFYFLFTFGSMTIISILYNFVSAVMIVA
jgi:hypothetical protein